MSSSASIVQLLPLHIVESIIDYARATHDVDYRFDKQEALAIIHSCQSWRSVFLKRACSSVSFTFDVSSSSKFTFRKCPHIITPLTYATGHYVRHLSICSGSWDPIMDGSILAWMHETGISNLLFQSAESLTIRINDLSNTSTLPEEKVIAAVQNIGAFLKNIRSMVPNIKNADITWYTFVFSTVDQSLGSFISHCINHILRGLQSLSFAEYGGPTGPTHIAPEHTSQLTHLAYRFSDGHTWFTELVRHNASTLEGLKILWLRKGNFELLLCDNNAEPVVYPFLKLLKLEDMDGYNPESGLSDTAFDSSGSELIHFPSLESFSISGDFSFVENVFLPGKNSTLRHLSVFFHRGTFMQSSTVFEKYALTQFCNLSSIRLNSDMHRPHTDTHIYNGQIAFLRSSLTCSTNVKKFTYFGNMDICRFFQEAQNSSTFQSLQILNIQDAILSFADIILLLKSAPFLQSLKCGINNKAPKIDGVGPSKLPGYISSMHPLNKLIQGIKLNAKTSPPIKYIAKTAILLAIGCPRLSKFGCLAAADVAVRNEIKNISKTKPFVEFTEQCRFISSRIHY